MPKETSPEISSRAGQLLALGKPEWMDEAYWDNLKGILGSCLSQDETPGQGPKCETGQRAIEFFCNIYRDDRNGAGLIGFRSADEAMSIPDEYGVIARVKHLIEFTEGEGF